MAKKKSLKEGIDALIDALGAAEKPSSAQIRNELVVLALDAKMLEDGKALAQKDARISDLETALKRSDVQLANLKILLEKAGEELEALREEEKKRDEEDSDLPDVQLQILKSLPSENSGAWWSLSEIAHMARKPIDEAEIHVERLRFDGLIVYHWIGETKVWYRTIPGSEIVLSHRLADGDQPAAKAYKYGDLPKRLHEALFMIGRNPEGIDEWEVHERCGLESLEIHSLAEQKFITGQYGSGRMGRILFLMLPGIEYLGERGLF